MKISINDYLKLVPTFVALEVSPISLKGRTISYQTSAVDSNRRPLGTGFGLSKEVSILKALNESVERSVFSWLKLSKSEEIKRTLFLDEHPSSCGFAVSQSEAAAASNAVAESVERWIRSKWIDENFYLPEIEADDLRHSELLLWSLKQFKKVRVFRKVLSFYINSEKAEADSIIVVGYDEKGAYVGSSTKINRTADLDHALMEAWRHWKIARSTANHFREEEKPIRFFSENADYADLQISKAKRLNLHCPQIKLLRAIRLPISNFFCVRAICDEYTGWHINDGKRFVY